MHRLIDEVHLGLGKRRTGQLLRGHIGQHAGRTGQGVEVRLNLGRKIGLAHRRSQVGQPAPLLRKPLQAPEQLGIGIHVGVRELAQDPHGVRLLGVQDGIVAQL